ncbi:MAG: MoaD/ThiS family protein [Caulobacteraceae bacterium]|nr:MoaD/ThiS family protein [Caulobacter sp.]
MARVLLFGRLVDVAGWREREVAGARLSAVREALAAGDTALGDALGSGGVQAAVDGAIVRGDADLQPASEVAFLPPMSGG